MRVFAVLGRLDDVCKFVFVLCVMSVEVDPIGTAYDNAERALVLLGADRLADAAKLLDATPPPPPAAYHAAGRVWLARASIDLARGADRALSSAETATTALGDARALGGGATVFVIDGVAIP